MEIERYGPFWSMVEGASEDGHYRWFFQHVVGGRAWS
jgi:hypothetical protein